MKNLKNLLALIPSLLTFGACFNQNSVVQNADGKAPSTSIYDIPLTTIEGEATDLKAYKGKKIVLLNVASKCGYTPQYADWEAFYREHGERVVVLGFPANNFMGQEPGSNEEIAAFCERNYGVSFPMFEKLSVKGGDQHPLYAWLTDPGMNGWNKKEPSWNFCKYVIDEEGRLTHFFASGVKPGAAEFRQAVGL
ncbi:MAG: hypothetical protein RLY31_587 [Bacteroidota bacterium]|jgi:glutathione peroxidase